MRHLREIYDFLRGTEEIDVPGAVRGYDRDPLPVKDGYETHNCLECLKNDKGEPYALIVGDKVQVERNGADALYQKLRTASTRREQRQAIDWFLFQSPAGKKWRRRLEDACRKDPYALLAALDAANICQW